MGKAGRVQAGMDLRGGIWLPPKGFEPRYADEISATQGKSRHCKFAVMLPGAAEGTGRLGSHPYPSAAFFTQLGGYTSLRFLFAFLRDFERNRDLTPTDNIDARRCKFRAFVFRKNEQSKVRWTRDVKPC
jgi:hypothetical protein